MASSGLIPQSQSNLEILYGTIGVMDNKYNVLIAIISVVGAVPTIVLSINRCSLGFSDSLTSELPCLKISLDSWTDYGFNCHS